MSTIDQQIAYVQAAETEGAITPGLLAEILSALKELPNYSQTITSINGSISNLSQQIQTLQANLLSANGIITGMSTDILTLQTSLNSTNSTANKALTAIINDMWTAAGGTYNATTGYYSMNGLTDITYQQAVAILVAPGSSFPGYHCTLPKARTNITATDITPSTASNTTPRNLSGVSYQNRVIEVIVLGRDNGFDSDGFPIPTNIVTHNLDSAFYYNDKLKRIIGNIGIRNYNGDDTVFYNYTFNRCTALEVVHLKNWAYNTDWSWCKNLIVSDTIQFLIDNKINTTPITVDLHPDVFSQLTAVMIQQASSKYISFVEKDPY